MKRAASHITKPLELKGQRSLESLALSIGSKTSGFWPVEICLS